MTRPSLELRIDSLDDEGRGRATHEGAIVIVPGTAPGSHVRVNVVHRDRRGQLFGEVIERLAAGTGEREAPCHHAAPTRGRCGGCPLMHLDEDTQRNLKRDMVNDALAPLNQRIDELKSLAPDLGWRNRTTLLAFRTGSGTVRLGSRAPRTGEFARMRGCLVVHPAIQRTADAIEDFLRSEPSPDAVDADAPPDHERQTEGTDAPSGAGPSAPPPPALRQVSLRTNSAGQVLVELVARDQEADISPLVTAVASMDDVVAIWTGVRESEDNVLRSHGSTPNVAPGRLPAEFDGRSYPLDPGSFFQLNTPVAEAMAARLVELLGAGSASLAWDLYCGVGVLGHTMLQHAVASSVIGADVIQSAIDVATSVGSGLPGQEGSSWICANLDGGLPAQMAESTPPDVVIFNPPRRGIATGLLEQVISQRPPVIAFMSCSPRTFARDARMLLDAGWDMTEVEAWDMMPQTAHVELLGVFRRPA